MEVNHFNLIKTIYKACRLTDNIYLVVGTGRFPVMIRKAETAPLSTPSNTLGSSS